MAAPTTLSTTIAKDGTLVIPKKLRKALKWADGQSVVLQPMNGGLLIETSTDSPLRAKAKALVRQAKLDVANRADTLTEDEVRAHYDSAAAALRKALRAKRAKRTNIQ